MPTGHVMVNAARNADQSVAGNGYDSSVPGTSHPGQTALDDICPHQIPGVLPGVGASHRAVQVKCRRTKPLARIC